MKKIFVPIIVIILAAGAWWYWGGENADRGGETIKIGVATPLTGEVAFLGTNILRAAELTVKGINEKAGREVVRLVPEDSGLDSKGGINAVTKLIRVDGVEVIIAGMSSNGTLAAAPLANNEHAVLISPVTGGKNIDDAGEYVFRLGNADVLAGSDLAHYTTETFGHRRVALVNEETDYNLGIRDSFLAAVPNKNIVVANEIFLPNTVDFRTTLAKLKANNPDAIVITSQTGKSAGAFVKQARELGISVPIFTDFLTGTNAEVKEIAGGALEGIYFLDPAYDAQNADVKKFFELYTDTYGASSPIPFHAAATHDAIVMLAEAAGDAGYNGKNIHDWLLEHVQNYKGFMGAYSFDKNGNTNLGFILKQLRNGNPLPVE